jgi:hypothetical protein
MLLARGLVKAVEAKAAKQDDIEGEIKRLKARAEQEISKRFRNEAFDALADAVHGCYSDAMAYKVLSAGLLRADGRAMQGKTWNFDGEGRAAIQTAMDLFEDMVSQVGQGAVTVALLTVLERTAKGQVHRVELTQ